MRARHLTVLVLLLSSPLVTARQQPVATAAPAVTNAPPVKPWIGRSEEFETFMRTAPFRRVEEVPIGVTRPKRGYFDPGGLVASAAWKVLPPPMSELPRP